MAARPALTLGSDQTISASGEERSAAIRKAGGYHGAVGPPPPQPPRRRRARRTPPVVWAVLATFLLHGILFGTVAVLTAAGWLFQRPEPLSQVEQPQPVAMRPLSADQWAQNRGEPAPPKPDAPEARAKPPPPPRPKPKKDERPDGQIVDVAPGNGESDPDAKYVAETSNRVDRQTRAKEQTPFYRNAMPRSTTTTPQGESTNGTVAPQSGNDGLGDDDRPLDNSQQKLALEVPDIEARDEVKLDSNPLEPGTGPRVSNRPESLAMQGNSNRLRIQPGSPSEGSEGSQGRAGKPGPLHLMPSLTVLDSVVGGAPNDHLDEAIGDGTYLSTREWRHASFFNRIKQSVGMTWNPSAELMRRDPTGNVYSGRDRHTVLTVTIDKDGRLKDVFVSKSSGLDFLDLEAVRSFERAQPFPNPPPALVGGENAVSFQFGFFVQMDGGVGRARVFRTR